MRASDGALIRGVIEPLIYGVRVWGNADNMGLRRGVKDTDVCRVEGCPARFMMYGSVADGGEKGNWCFETLPCSASCPFHYTVILRFALAIPTELLRKTWAAMSPSVNRYGIVAVKNKASR